MRTGRKVMVTAYAAGVTQRSPGSQGPHRRFRNNVTMRRRTLILGWTAAAAAAGGLTGCSTGAEAEAPAPSTTPSSSPSVMPSPTASAAPVLASTFASSLAPQSVTDPYEPLPIKGPTRAYAVGKKVYPDFGRGVKRPLPTTVWYPASGNAPPSGPAPRDD